MGKGQTVIDLFCGAGGLSEGFRQAGLHVVAGNDFDEAAGETFAATHTEAKFLGGSIKNIKANEFLKASGLKKGELYCLVGGPPCQAYSVYNHQRGMHDERSQLFKDYLRIVEGLSPSWIVIENVTGITSAGEGAAVLAILNGLKALGYYVEHKILRAEEYGIPQERRRVVFIGNRLGLPIVWPTPTHGNEALPLTTIYDAISDLPPLANGEDNGIAAYARSPRSVYQRILRGNTKRVLNHAAPKLSEINIERMKHIPQGGSWRDIPIKLLPAGMKKARRCDHTKRYGRMLWDDQACTILTKCDLHWGAYIHPEQNRAITVREAARLQSFPDWFEFKGSRTEQYIQVGNAVPPLLGRQIAQSILKAQISNGRRAERTQLRTAVG